MAKKPAPAPAPTIGHNKPPRDKPNPVEVSDQIAIEYQPLAEETTTALAAARDLPAAVTTDEQAGDVAKSVKDMRSLWDRIEAVRKAEKDPYFRTAQAVDTLFNGMKERLDKAMDILGKRVHSHNQRKLAEERAAREAELAAAAEEARKAREKLEAEQRAADEAAAAAARARKPENIEAHEERAQEHEANAAEARVDALMAADALTDARISAAAKSADIVRTRHASGATVTMRQVGYVEIVDRNKLNLETLRPFIKDDHLLMALRAWAKTHGHTKSMEGAIVEMRDDTTIL